MIHCRRVGFVRVGGHCLICGFDIPPYAGVHAGKEWITCADRKCTALARVMSSVELQNLSELKGKHHSEEVRLCPRKRPDSGYDIALNATV